MGNLAKISPPENYFTPIWDFSVAEGSCQSYLAKLFHVIANILRIPTVIINEQYQQFVLAKTNLPWVSVYVRFPVTFAGLPLVDSA